MASYINLSAQYKRILILLLYFCLTSSSASTKMCLKCGKSTKIGRRITTHPYICTHTHTPYTHANTPTFYCKLQHTMQARLPISQFMRSNSRPSVKSRQECSKCKNNAHKRSLGFIMWMENYFRFFKKFASAFWLLLRSFASVAHMFAFSAVRINAPLKNEGNSYLQHAIHTHSAK